MVNLEKLQRVNVVGTSASGKSSFSRALAARLGSPAIEMDALFWGPNWQQASDEVFFARVARALDRPNWVLDGNYDRTMPVKWAQVETVIWLDYSFSRTLFQSFKRATARVITGQELWPGTGNRESFRQTFFSKKSVILWMMQTYDGVKKRYRERMQDPAYAHIQFVHLRSPSEARAFLLSVGGL